MEVVPFHLDSNIVPNIWDFRTKCLPNIFSLFGTFAPNIWESLLKKQHLGAQLLGNIWQTFGCPTLRKYMANIWVPNAYETYGKHLGVPHLGNIWQTFGCPTLRKHMANIWVANTLIGNIWQIFVPNSCKHLQNVWENYVEFTKFLDVNNIGQYLSHIWQIFISHKQLVKQFGKCLPNVWYILLVKITEVTILDTLVKVTND